MSDYRLTAADLNPLHRALLGVLPDEGSMLGRYHVLARTTKQLVSELNQDLAPGEPPLKSSTVQTALRQLKLAGYAATVRLSSGNGWQATSAGRRVVASEAPKLGVAA